MKRIFGSLTFVVATAALTIGANAQSSNWRTSVTHDAESQQRPLAVSVIAFSGSMTGSFTTASTHCTVGFANRCPGLDCICYTLTGTASLSKVGKGTGTLYATLDFGSGVISGNGDCFPAYLEFDVSTAKDTETWSGVGSACDSVDGHALPLSGGLGLQTSNVATGAIVQLTMTPNIAAHTFKVKFAGKAER